MELKLVWWSKWTNDGRLLKVWQHLLELTDSRKALDLSETFADRMFSSAKKVGKALAQCVVQREQRS